MLFKSPGLKMPREFIIFLRNQLLCLTSYFCEEHFYCYYFCYSLKISGSSQTFFFFFQLKNLLFRKLLISQQNSRNHGSHIPLSTPPATSTASIPHHAGMFVRMHYPSKSTVYMRIHSLCTCHGSDTHRMTCMDLYDIIQTPKVPCAHLFFPPPTNP